MNELKEIQKVLLGMASSYHTPENNVHFSFYKRYRYRLPSQATLSEFLLIRS